MPPSLISRGVASSAGMDGGTALPPIDGAEDAEDAEITQRLPRSYALLMHLQSGGGFENAVDAQDPVLAITQAKAAEATLRTVEAEVRAQERRSIMRQRRSTLGHHPVQRRPSSRASSALAHYTGTGGTLQQFRTLGHQQQQQHKHRDFDAKPANNSWADASAIAAGDRLANHASVAWHHRLAQGRRSVEMWHDPHADHSIDGAPADDRTQPATRVSMAGGSRLVPLRGSTAAMASRVSRGDNAAKGPAAASTASDDGMWFAAMAPSVLSGAPNAPSAPQLEGHLASEAHSRGLMSGGSMASDMSGFTEAGYPPLADRNRSVVSNSSVSSAQARRVEWEHYAPLSLRRTAAPNDTAAKAVDGYALGTGWRPLVSTSYSMGTASVPARKSPVTPPPPAPPTPPVPAPAPAAMLREHTAGAQTAVALQSLIDRETEIERLRERLHAAGSPPHAVERASKAHEASVPLWHASTAVAAMTERTPLKLLASILGRGSAPPNDNAVLETGSAPGVDTEPAEAPPEQAPTQQDPEVTELRQEAVTDVAAIAGEPRMEIALAVFARLDEDKSELLENEELDGLIGKGLVPDDAPAQRSLRRLIEEHGGMVAEDFEEWWKDNPGDADVLFGKLAAEIRQTRTGDDQAGAGAGAGLGAGAGAAPGAAPGAAVAGVEGMLLETGQKKKEMLLETGQKKTSLLITTSADLTVDTRFTVIVNSVSPEFQSSGSDSGINFSVWKTLTGYAEGEKPPPVEYDQAEFTAQTGAAPTYADVLWSEVPAGSAAEGSALKYIVHALAPDLSTRPKRLFVHTYSLSLSLSRARSL